MFEQIIGMIAPHVCMCCSKEGTLLCPDCQKVLPPSPARYPELSHTKSVFGATAYAGVAQELVHKLKFERALAAADAIAAIIADRMPDPTSQSMIVSFVPTAPSRVRIRGYDQAALIARRVAALRRLPCATLLQRTGRQRQVGQGRAVRQRQLQGAFRLCGSIPGEQTTVLLIDDVLTTGATMEAAAAALRKSGVANVYAAVFAVA